MDLGDIRDHVFEPYLQAPQIIAGLIADIEDMQEAVQNLTEQLEYEREIHKDAEKKLLKKVANAQSKQSDIAGETDEGPGTKVHPKRKSRKRPRSSDE